MKNISIKVGDVSLFEKLIESLKIPERWKTKIKEAFLETSIF